MGFFQIEAITLKIQPKVIQSLVGPGLLEEEREQGSETSEDSVKEIDLAAGLTLLPTSYFVLFIEKTKVAVDDSFAKHHHLEIFCPPPEA